MSRQLKQAANFFFIKLILFLLRLYCQQLAPPKFPRTQKKIFSKILTQGTLWNGHLKYIICAFQSDCLKSLTFDFIIQTHRAVNEDIDFQQYYPDSYPLYDQRRIINVVQHVCSNMDGVWRRFVCVWHQKFHFIRQSVNSKVMYNISLTCVSIKLPPSQSSEIASKKMHTQNLKASHNGEKKIRCWEEETNWQIVCHCWFRLIEHGLVSKKEYRSLDENPV